MSYKIKFDKFFSYSFSLDCVIFSFIEGEINVLLIKRAVEPFKGFWAIPGDLVYPQENLPDAANRILTELTKLSNIQLHQGQTFGQPDRHPQGRVITNAYFALVRAGEIKAEASSWADQIKWVPVKKLPELGFDHNDILNSTYELLKQKLQRQPICFDMLPKKFTLSELQLIYEYAFEVTLDKANFRKKIKPLPIINLREKQKNVNHRPGYLYTFDKEEYNKLIEEDNYLFKL